MVSQLLAMATINKLYIFYIVDKPYCTYNTTYVKSALEETAKLTCFLNSNPSNLRVNWTFNDKLVAYNQKAEKIDGNTTVMSHTIYVDTRWL